MSQHQETQSQSKLSALGRAQLNTRNNAARTFSALICCKGQHTLLSTALCMQRPCCLTSCRTRHSTTPQKWSPLAAYCCTNCIQRTLRCLEAQQTRLKPHKRPSASAAGHGQHVACCRCHSDHKYLSGLLPTCPTTSSRCECTRCLRG